MNRKVIGTGLVLVLGGLVVWKIVSAYSAPDPRRQNIPLVLTELPLRQTITSRLKFNGDILPIQQAAIYPKVAGNLEAVYVDIGSPVRKGELLALIDTTELTQQVHQTAATYENARLNEARTRELFSRDLIARQELDNIQAAMKVAKANYESASTRLGYAYITAPFAGIITRRFLDAGANVKANDATLFTLMDMDRMKIIINALEKDIPLMTRGKKAVVTVDAYPGREFPGTLTRLSQAVDLSTRTMGVQIDIQNTGHLLKPGMFASIVLVVDEHAGAMTVPTQALLKDDKGTYVFVSGGNIAHRKNVAAGEEQSGRTEIREGLRDTDSVITAGQQLVKDGSQVAPRN